MSKTYSKDKKKFTLANALQEVPVMNPLETVSDNYPTLMLDGGLKYRGKTLANMPHTDKEEGVLVWPNGDYYRGEFKHGKRHGKGKRVNKDGSVYIGDYEDD